MCINEFNACLICSHCASLITGYFSCLGPCAMSEPDFHSFINIAACEFPSASFMFITFALAEPFLHYPELWSRLWYDISNLARSCESQQILLKILGSQLCHLKQ